MPELRTRTDAHPPRGERGTGSATAVRAEDEAAIAAEVQEDIYALLGVRPDAGRTLAREMYWNRMQPLLEPGRRDAAETPEQIESLNRALAIILDDRLRAAYDDARSRRPRRASAAAEDEAPLVSTSRRFLVAGLALLALVAGGVAVVVASTEGVAQALSMLPVAAVSALLIASAWVVTRHRRTAPLEALGLLHGASVAQIDLAYRARAQELLIQLTYDERAIAGLDRLDRAYVKAMATALESAAPPTPRGRRERALRFAGRLMFVLVMALWRLLRAAVREGGPLLLALARRVRRAARATGNGQRAIRARAFDAVGARADDARGLELPRINLEQRLAASFKASAMQLAEPAEAAAPAETPDEHPAAWLLLESAAGTRRVPIATRPIRIGSARQCDLVLPEREGVAAEHAMVWRRGDAVILHVSDPQANCTVNGDPVSWARLDDGDALLVGTVTFRVEARIEQVPADDDHTAPEGTWREDRNRDPRLPAMPGGSEDVRGGDNERRGNAGGSLS